MLDVDGTLTDGGVYITESGDEFKKYNTKDGLAITRLLKNGMHVGIVSASKSTKSVIKRADMLGIEYCYVGEAPKTDVLTRWAEDLRLPYSAFAFLGDDINDKAIMQQVGFSACPADASPGIKKIVHLVLESKGGDACFREMVDKCFPIDKD